MSAPLLDVEGIEAVYGASILALRDVSLSVASGEIVALIGPNGAGKTTTLRAISNLLGAQRGSLRRGAIRWQGEATGRLDPADLFARGIVQVLEGRHVFGQLTVEENLLTGGYLRRPSRRQLAEDLERIYAWFPRLKQRRGVKAGLTSGGEQQMVAIGRALMTRPTLLLLDEPSMGLAPIIVAEIFEIVARLNREEGVSVLVAEQSANLVLDHAHRAVVLESGRGVASGSSAELAASGRLGALYLGADANHRVGSAFERGDRRPVRRHARPDRSATCRAGGCRRHRCRYQADGPSLRCLPSLDDDPGRRSAHRTSLHGSHR